MPKNRKIENFYLDLEKLQSIESTQELKGMMKPIQVNNLGIAQKLVAIERDVILKRMLIKEEKRIVRIYVIEGINLTSSFGQTYRPLPILKLDDKQFDERINYILDEANPTFFQHYEFEVYFPDCPCFSSIRWTMTICLAMISLVEDLMAWKIGIFYLNGVLY